MLRLLSLTCRLRMAVQPVEPALEVQHGLPDTLRRGLRADLPLLHPGTDHSARYSEQQRSRRLSNQAGYALLSNATRDQPLRHLITA